METIKSGDATKRSKGDSPAIRKWRIDMEEQTLSDDYLAAASALFPEWSSPEDEAAFRDL